MKIVLYKKINNSLLMLIPYTALIMNKRFWKGFLRRIHKKEMAKITIEIGEWKE